VHSSDEQLREWKNPSEDNFIERKTCADSRDWVKTVVGFANSTPLDRYAILYIGVRNDGSVENTTNLDSVQKKLR
jgi:predicted HTH transcriptional regulator